MRRFVITITQLIRPVLHWSLLLTVVRAHKMSDLVDAGTMGFGQQASKDAEPIAGDIRLGSDRLILFLTLTLAHPGMRMA